MHIAEGTPVQNGTKVWITRKGNCLVENNVARIPDRKLQIIIDVIEARHGEIEALRLKKFGEITYYC